MKNKTSSAIVVVGSMAFDSIETPFGKVAKILGGSANHFSISASLFAPIRCVSVVGQDFPKDHLELLQSRGIDIQGVKIESGQTFHWAGKYGYDLNEAHTLATALNVFEKFDPEIPESYRDSQFVFLGNISPALQKRVLKQIRTPKFIALDTMNFWIEGQREELIDAISHCHALIINEGEIRQLTKNHNIVRAAEQVRAWGPKIIVVKRGEYGAVLFEADRIFHAAALPLTEVKDPTGAGDTFAGGFVGYLASQPEFTLASSALRKAVVYGSVMASFAVENFGSQELLKLSREKVDERFQKIVNLTSF